MVVYAIIIDYNIKERVKRDFLKSGKYPYFTGHDPFLIGHDPFYIGNDSFTNGYD